MSKAINPFKPTAGMNPPELIGRDAVLDDFAEALSDVATIDKPSKAEGRSLVMFLSAKKA